MPRCSVMFSFLFVTLLSTGCWKEDAPVAGEASSTTITKKSSFEHSFFLEHDLGTIDQDDIALGSVALRNPGNTPLHFTFSKPSCGCMIVTSIPTNILPGETGAFSFKLRALGLSGKHTYRILAWNEHKTTLATIEITAFVRSVRVKPKTIALGNLLLNNGKKRNMFILAAGYPDAEIISVESHASWLSLEHQSVATSNEASEQGGQAIGCYAVTWTGEGAQPGALFAEITLKVKVNEERMEAFTIPVTGYVVGEMEVVPPQIVFGRVSVSKPVERTCVLAFHEPPPNLSGVVCESDSPFVVGSLQVDSLNPNSWKLTARTDVSETIESGLIQGTLIGRNNEGKCVFSIPYTAISVAE